MAQTLLSCLLISLICPVLLFSNSFSQQVGEKSSFEKGEISGTYIHIDTTPTPPSDLPKCPHEITIHDNALQTEGAIVYKFNLGALEIFTEECTYNTEGNETAELKNYTGPTKNLIMLTMSLPGNILKCLPDNPDNTFPTANFSFIPSMMGRFNMSIDNDEVTTDQVDQPTKTYDYILLLEMAGQKCTFFPEGQYKAFKEYIEDKLADGPPDSDFEGDRYEGEDQMKIGKGKSLKFCPICKCQEKLGTDLDLDTIEMSEDDTTDMNDDKTEIPSPEMDEDAHWRPPRVLVRNHKCPVGFSKQMKDIIREDDMSEEEDEGIGKETKDLVLRAVVGKLYDEIRSEYGEKMDDADFDIRKEMVLAVMMTTLGRRRVMVMKRGARCGKKRRPIDEDTVLIYEKEHILSQLEHNPFVLKNREKAFAIRKSETGTEYAFSLHILQKKEKGKLSSCTLSNSRKSCDLLNSGDFCKSFKPFGSMSVVTTNDDLGDKQKPDGKETAKPSPQGSKEQGTDQGKSPTPSPILASPSPRASPVSGSGSAFCFPSEAKVELEDGSVIRMDELTVGDAIRDGTGGFSKVILFTHANKKVISEFIRLETKNADVILSAQHYIPVNGKLMTAESVREGDKIYTMRKGHKVEATVTRMEQVRMVGLFNPQTTDGSLAVRMSGDGVVVSAYTAGIEPIVAHTLLAPLRMIYNFLGVVVPWSWLFRNGSDTLVRMLPSGTAVISV